MKRKYPTNYFGVKLLPPLFLEDKYVFERKFTFLNWQHVRGKITHVGVVSYYVSGKPFFKVVYLSKKKTVYRGYYNSYKIENGEVFGTSFILASSKLLLDCIVDIDTFLSMFEEIGA